MSGFGIALILVCSLGIIGILLSFWVERDTW